MTPLAVWDVFTTLRLILWPEPTPHEHRLEIQETPHPYFGTTMLVWRCQTCPHREFLGMVWPDATNRTAA